MSPPISQKIESFVDVSLLSNNPIFEGKLWLSDFSVLPSVGVMYYQSQCNKDCLISSSLSNKGQCLQCKEKVLFKGKCVEFCDIGFYNFGGRCRECSEERCAKLIKRQVFQVVQNNNKYEITRLVPINPPTERNYFDIIIPGLVLNRDYKVRWVSDTFTEKQTVEIEFLGDNESRIKSVIFKFKGEGFYDEEKNRFFEQYYIFNKELKDQNVTHHQDTVFTKLKNKVKAVLSGNYEMASSVEKKPQAHSALVIINKSGAQEVDQSPIVYTSQKFDEDQWKSLVEMTSGSLELNQIMSQQMQTFKNIRENIS